MTRAMGDEAVSAESVESVKVPRALASVVYGGSVVTVGRLGLTPVRSLQAR